MDREDVRMLQARGDTDLATKPLRAESVRDLWAQHLERDHPVMLEVAREKYRRHAAAPELVLERIAVGQRFREGRVQVGQRSQRDAGERERTRFAWGKIYVPRRRAARGASRGLIWPQPPPPWTSWLLAGTNHERETLAGTHPSCIETSRDLPPR